MAIRGRTPTRSRRIKTYLRRKRHSEKADFKSFENLIASPHDFGTINAGGAENPLPMPGNARLGISFSENQMASLLTVNQAGSVVFSHPSLEADDVFKGQRARKDAPIDVLGDSLSGDMSMYVFDPLGAAHLIATGSFGEESTPGYLFIVGNTNDSVYRYSMENVKDISGATYDSLAKVVTSQDNSPQAVAFNLDGTKMYIAGDQNNRIFQYTLSTPYDPSTASYDSVSLDITSHEPNVRDLRFSPDGAKLYVNGVNRRGGLAYDLSSPFDISTAEYNGEFVFLNAWGGRDASCFSPDGMALYATGSSGFVDTGHVAKFNLSIAWDITTAVYAGLSPNFMSLLGLSASSPGIRGMALNPDESKLYLTRNTNATIYELDLDTPGDITTMSYDSVSYSTASEAAGPFDLQFKPDGTKLYILRQGGSTARVYQYSLSTPWDLGTISYDSVFFSLTGQNTSPLHLAFKPDGTKMYMTSVSGALVYQYSLSSAWEVSSLSYDSVVYDYSDITTSALMLSFNADGDKMLLMDGSTAHSYVLSSPWVVSSASLDGGTFYTHGADSQPTNGLFFDPTGDNVFTVGRSRNRVLKIPLSTPYDISTADIYGGSHLQLINSYIWEGMWIDSTGTKMFLIESTNDQIHQFTLSSPWDITTATDDAEPFTVSQDATPNALFFVET